MLYPGESIKAEKLEWYEMTSDTSITPAYADRLDAVLRDANGRNRVVCG